MKSLKALYLFAITALFMFSSCGMVIRSYIKKDSENVPPDLGKEKTTIVVIQERNGYNKKIEKIFKKYYTGDYIFATRKELDDKYNDLINYRYVLDDDISVSKMYVTTITKDRSTGISTQSTAPQFSASRSFHILDRKARKIYDTGVSSGTSWKTILKTWLTKLEDERKKNETK